MITTQITYAGSFAEDGQITFHEVIRIIEPGVKTGMTTGPFQIIGVGDDVYGKPQIVQDVVSKLHAPAKVKARGKLKLQKISGVGREKTILFDGEWLEEGQIQVRRVTRIFEDGEQISKKYFRYVVDVGDPVTNEPQIVKDLAQGLHTPARIAARIAFKQQQEIDNAQEN